MEGHLSVGVSALSECFLTVILIFLILFPMNSNVNVPGILDSTSLILIEAVAMFCSAFLARFHNVMPIITIESK